MRISKVHICPTIFHGAHLSIISVQPHSAGLGKNKKKRLLFENHRKKKLFKMCFRTQITQKITWKKQLFSKSKKKKNLSHDQWSGVGHWWRNDGVHGANLNSTKKSSGAKKYIEFSGFFSWWGKIGLSSVAATNIDIFS